MPLDSLGLGLTLDTTILEKAEKKLENMHNYSRSIMNNLERGIRAFNSKEITDFSEVLNHVQKALSKINGTELSIDYDKKGLKEYKDGINDILDLTVRLSEKSGGLKFYDPKKVNRTDESPREVRKRLNDLLAEYKTFEEKLNKADAFDSDSAKYTKRLEDSKEEIERLVPSVDKLKEAFDKTRAAYQKYVDTQSKKIRKSTPDATEEEIQKILLTREAYIKKANAMIEAQSAYEKEEQLLKEQQELYNNASSAQFFSEHRQDLEENSAMLRESIKEAAADLEWANKTVAEKSAALLADQSSRDKEEKSRITQVQNTYKELREAIEQGEKELADTESMRETVAKGKGDTAAYDAKIKELKAFLDEKKDIETTWRKSEYWPALEAIDKQFNKRKLKTEYKEKLDSPTVEFANQYSKSASSLEEHEQAVTLLRNAMKGLSENTAHYGQVVNAINKRISKHTDHIKLLTHEQKESKELQDSVISRYIREKKEIRELNTLLKELHEKQSSTGVKTTEEDKYEQDIIARKQRLWNDVKQIETDNAQYIAQLREKFDASVAEEKISEIIKQNEREKQEYAKLLDDLYDIEKKKKSMEEAGGGVGDAAYDELLQQEAELNARKTQLETQHQNDLDKIKKEHNKKRNDEDIKAFIAAQEEKERRAKEQAKYDSKSRKESYQRYITSSEGAMYTADKAMGKRRSVENLQKAISNLEAAQRKVNTSTKQGREEFAKLDAKLVKTRAEMARLTGQTHSLSNAFGPIGRAIATAFSVQSIRGYVGKMIEVRKEMERQQKALQIILGNKEQANLIWDKTMQLAVKSPFTIQELTSYTRQLAAYRIETSKLYETNKMLADVSAGLGVDMSRLILAFGQVKAASFLRGTELRQFTEAGIPMLEELANHFTELRGRIVTVDQAFDMISKRQVSFKDVEQVFKNMTREGGVFFNMQEEMSNTLHGKISNLKDSITIMLNEIGASNEGIIHDALDLVKSLVENWRYVAAAIKTVIKTYVAYQVTSTVIALLSGRMVYTMNQLAIGQVAAAQTTNRLTLALARLGNAMRGVNSQQIGGVGGLAGTMGKLGKYLGPIGMITTAVIGGVTAFNAYNEASEETSSKEKRRQDEMKQNLEQLNRKGETLARTIHKIRDAFKNAVDSDNIIDQRIQLQKLIDIANEEYKMVIKVEVDKMSAEEAAETMNKIHTDLIKTNTFATSYASSMERRMPDFAQNVENYTSNISDIYARMDDILNVLNNVVGRKIATYKWDDTQSNMDNLYQLWNVLDRAYNELLDKYGPPSIDEEEEERRDIIKNYVVAYKDMVAKAWLALEDIQIEAEAAAKGFGYSTAKKAGLLVPSLKKGIATYLSQKGVEDREIEQLLRDSIGDYFKVDLGEVTSFEIKPWQERWNKYLDSIKATTKKTLMKEFGDNTKMWNAMGFEESGFFPSLPAMFTEANADQTEEQHKAYIEAEIKRYKELKEAYEKGIREAGVVDESLYQESLIALPALEKALLFHGGGSEDKSAKKKLQDQIKLLEEMHKEYLKIKKTYGDIEAEAKVRKAFKEPFEKVFEGTGISFDAYMSKDDMVKALSRLKDLAKKAGPEVEKLLDTTIAGYEAEIDIVTKENADKDLRTQVQDLFDRQKLTAELKELHIPQDVAQKLFGVEFLDSSSLKSEVIATYVKNVAEEARGKVAAELAKGAAGADWDFIGQYIGDVPMEQIKKDIENVFDVIEKEQLASAKRFAKFLTKNLDKSKVVMYQRGIDIDFAKNEFKEGRISAEQFAETVKNIVAQSNEEISKINLDKFKEAPEYIQAMGNLTAYSITELNGLKTKLEELISANGKAFSAEEMLVYQKVLEKIGERIDLLDDNLWFRDSDIEKLKEIKRVEGEITDEKKAEAVATVELKRLEAERAETTAKLSLLENQREEATKKGESTAEIDKQILDLTSQITTKNEEILQVQGTIKKSKTVLSELGEEMDRLLDGQTKAMARVEAGLNVFNKSLSLAVDTYTEIEEIAKSFGTDTESLGWKQTENVMDMLQGFGTNAASAASKFASGDIFGGIMDSIKAVKELIVGINKIHDEALEDTIQKHLEDIENLQREYEKLEWVIGRVFAFDRYGMVAEQTKNLGKQIENTSKAIALEEAKKDTDEERIKELKENAEQARREIHELYDNLREEIVGSYEDLSSTLADAMIEALKNGEDALKAWGDEVDNIITNIVTKLAVQKYVEPQVSQALDQFYNKTMPRNAAAEKAFARLQKTTVGTKEYNDALAEYEELNKKALGELPQITEDSLNALKASLDAIGLSFEPIARWITGIVGGEGGSLSELQKGIQGVTEQTAQVLEALLNSMRDTQANAYHELQKQTRILGEIRDTLDAVSGNGPRAFSVRM